MVTPINGPDGRPEKLLSVSRDVTAAKEAESKLRESEELTRAILDTLGEGFIALDSDFRIIDINAEGLRLDDRPLEEIVGHSH